LIFQKELFTKFVFRKFLYLDDRLYTVHPDSGLQDSSSPAASAFTPLVISKRHYFETSRTFPIQSTKDIHLAVKTDIASISPFTPNRFLMRKVTTANEETTVNLWLLDEDASRSLQDLGCLIVVPETALLAFLDPGAPRLYSIERDRGTVYVHITRDGLVRSMASREDGADLWKFTRIIGFAAKESQAVELHEKDYFPLLFQVLHTLPPTSLLPFINPDSLKQVIKDKRLKITMIILSALCLAYMAIAAFTPYFAEKWLRQQNSQLTQSLAGVLDKKGAIDSLGAKQRLLADQINRYTYKLPILNLLNDIVPEKTRIAQVTLSGNMVELRGTTPKASELLAALTQTKGIRNAQFTSPLTQDTNAKTEMFTLTFMYARE